MSYDAVDKVFNKLLIVILLLSCFGLLYLLAPILMPFVAGALLAYLTDPLVNKLMSYHLSRLTSVLIVFSLLFFSIILFIVLLIPVIHSQISALIALIPDSFTWIQTQIWPWLQERLHLQGNFDADTVKDLIGANILKAGGAVSVVMKTILSSGRAFFEILLTILLIPVVTFYMLRDWNILLDKIRSVIPKKIRPRVVELATECDAVLSAFFRGQFIVMLLLGAVYAIGLSAIGLNTGVIIGVIVGFLSIVPYLGFIVGIFIASIAALVQFGTVTSLAWVFLVFLMGNIIENMILVPNLIGDRIGLHPVVVIFAVLAGGTLFGFFGVLLALPVAAVLMVLLRNAYSHYHGKPVRA